MKIMRYLLKYTPLIIISIVAAVATVYFQLEIPVNVGKAIDMISTGDDFAKNKLLMYCCYAIMCAGFAGGAQWLMSLINNAVVNRVSRDIRVRAFDVLQNTPLSYIDSHSAGDVVSRITTDIDQFADGLLLGFSQLFTGVITIIGTIFFMMRLDVKIAVMVILLTPLSLFVAGFISKKTHKYFASQSERRGKLTGLIDEMVGNEKVVQAFSYEEKAAERFDELNEELTKASFKATFYSSIVNPATRFVNNIIYAAVAVVGAFLALSSGITVGNLVTFLSYANQYMKPFNEISNVLTELQNALACADRVMQLIDAEKETADKDGAEKLSEIMNSLPEDRRGTVEIDDISFSYDKDKELLKDLSLSVKPGMRVAIVGPTGSGKSTLINLLMRFYEVDEGSIRIEDRDIRDVTRESLRECFGMVLQETWLKTASVRDNICYGIKDATDEEVERAAELTHADRFIKLLPDGYDTILSEDGGSLSEGQKQLLCITRVMLRIPPMLILDEATSSIDTRTEHRVQRSFAKMMQGRTSFIVAHRLSTIREADMILVMKDGNIIEQGTHEELLEKNGFYKELYYSQFEN
ncbi:ATP-binding cassette, subfamily B [Lachnospiraceae bacterium]|nr:ATP-binding cassette, subfamily B [Lachnospiraceae bacterium]